jgi:glutathionylspermidine synthase
VADESNQEAAKSPSPNSDSGMTAAERAELAELRASRKAAELEKAKSEEAMARANGEFAKVQEILEKRHKEAAEEAAQLKSWKAQRESEDRRMANTQRLAETAGVAPSPVLRGLIREAEASGRFKADAENVSENDLKAWAKELQKMAPEAFAVSKEKPPLLVRARAADNAEVDDEDAAIVARAKSAWGNVGLPKHLQRT